jgi:ABC-2 type transport system permease protein
MRPYLAIFSARFRMMLQYRAAAVAGIWTQIAFGLILIMIYEGFYSSSTQAPPIRFSQIVSYVWLGQALLALLPWSVEAEIRAMVRNGTVAYELCRPVDLYNLWFARALAWRVAPALMRAVPLSLFATLILPVLGLGEWRLQLPSPSGGAMFAAAMVCTVLLGCALTTLINITLLWTISNDGAYIVLTAMATLFSGMVVPLPLFPDWVQPILMVLPFAGLVDLPFRLYTGHIEAARAPSILALQIFWIGVLVLTGRRLLAKAMRRVVVQGG